VPELIRTSPLTQREWQVLGLIYSGYSNEQIAGELDVAATTIKTHIRNCIRSWAWRTARMRFSMPSSC
jgi:LuxR family maltose regulon positive regulatory protein